MKPVIAIPQTGNSLMRRYMKSKYVQSLRRAGAEVRWIELTDPEKAVAEVMACDGLLLPGGGDVNPVLYGQTPTDQCGKPNDLRDRVELSMLEAFLPTNKPVLCICRGIQVLNVFFNGTLHQDIKNTQACRHFHFASRGKGIHHVMVYPNSKLGHILADKTIKVNSMHHQAVDRLGPGLNVCAVSEDGFIEGVEILLHPFCIGLQWHPEHMSENHPQQQKIFDAFVQACNP